MIDENTEKARTWLLAAALAMSGAGIACAHADPPAAPSAQPAPSAVPAPAPATRVQSDADGGAPSSSPPTAISAAPAAGYMRLSLPVTFETNSAKPGDPFMRLVPSLPSFPPRLTNVTIVTHCGTREKSGIAQARVQALRDAISERTTSASIESKPAPCADDDESLQASVIFTVGSPTAREGDDPLAPGVNTRIRLPFETNSATPKNDSDPSSNTLWELVVSNARPDKAVFVTARCSKAEVPAIAKARTQAIRAKLVKAGIRSNAINAREEACAGGEEAQLVEVQVRGRP